MHCKSRKHRKKIKLKYKGNAKLRFFRNKKLNKMNFFRLTFVGLKGAKKFQ